MKCSNLPAFLALLLGVGGCRNPAAESVADGPNPEAAPSRASVSADDGATERHATNDAAASDSWFGSPCEEIERRLQKAASELDYPELVEHSRFQLGCFPNPDGTAWGLLAENAHWKKAPADAWIGPRSLEVELHLVYLDARGRVQSGPRLAYSELADGPLSHAFSPPEFYDYDDDGKNEVLLWQSRVVQVDDTPFLSGVVTATREGVMPYRPTVGLSILGLEDIDHDGRPDLQLFREYIVTTPEDEEGLADIFFYGAPFYAHALPDGSFSLEDEVAQARLRELCPRAPDPIRPPLEAGRLDNELFKRNLVCALLWGNTRGARAALATCSSKQRTMGSVASEGGGKPLTDYEDIADCADVEQLRGWLDPPPPITLR